MRSSSGNTNSDGGTTPTSTIGSRAAGIFQEGLKMTRRGFSITAAGAALAALLAPNAAAAVGDKRTVVITGANSGIGLDAATKLVRA